MVRGIGLPGEEGGRLRWRYPLEGLPQNRQIEVFVPQGEQGVVQVPRGGGGGPASRYPLHLSRSQRLPVRDRADGASVNLAPQRRG